MLGDPVHWALFQAPIPEHPLQSDTTACDAFNLQLSENLLDVFVTNAEDVARLVLVSVTLNRGIKKEAFAPSTIMWLQPTPLNA